MSLSMVSWRLRWPSPLALGALLTLLPIESTLGFDPVPEIWMRSPTRGAQADCGRPSLLCAADQNSSVVRGTVAQGMGVKRAFKKGSPALWVKAMPRWSSQGDFKHDV